jgi:hypothetical protein
MVFKGEGHVLADSERIVKRRLLKQETHLLPDLSHAVESQAGDVLAMNANRSGVGRIEANDEPQQHAFSRAAASQHGQGFSAVHAQADPV